MRKIIKGVLNHIFKNEEVTQLAEDRIMVCLTPDHPYPTCRYYKGEASLGPKCNACGCFLKYKTKSPKASCPLNKWEK